MSTTLNMYEEFRQFRIEELERENERLKQTIREVNSPEGLTNFMGKPVDYWLNLEVEVEIYRQEETCMCGDSIKSHNIASGHSPVSMLDYRLGNTEDENKRFKNALEIIAGKRQCVDNCMSNVDVAIAALKGEQN